MHILDNVPIVTAAKAWLSVPIYGFEDVYVLWRCVHIHNGIVGVGPPFKKSVFPIHRVAESVASRAASTPPPLFLLQNSYLFLFVHPCGIKRIDICRSALTC